MFFLYRMSYNLMSLSFVEKGRERERERESAGGIE